MQFPTSLKPSGSKKTLFKSIFLKNFGLFEPCFHQSKKVKYIDIDLILILLFDFGSSVSRDKLEKIMSWLRDSRFNCSVKTLKRFNLVSRFI